MSLDPSDLEHLVDDLRVARQDLTSNVDALMKVTDRLVELILMLIKAVR